MSVCLRSDFGGSVWFRVLVWIVDVVLCFCDLQAAGLVGVFL